MDSKKYNEDNLEKEIQTEEAVTDETDYDANEILKSITGPFESGTSKAVASIFLNNVYLGEEDSKPKVEELSYCATNNAELQIERRGELVQLDISFNSNADADLNKIWGILESYGELVHEELIKSELSPDRRSTLLIQLMPKKYDGEFIVDISFPIFWCLMPKTPNSHVFKIRILFDADSFNLYQIKGEPFADLAAEINFAENNRDFEELKRLQKKEERERFLDRRIELGKISK